MKALLLIVFLLHVLPVCASERLPLSHRTNAFAIQEASAAPANHLWKLALLGLAAFGFLIRKRL